MAQKWETRFCIQIQFGLFKGGKLCRASVLIKKTKSAFWKQGGGLQGTMEMPPELLLSSKNLMSSQHSEWKGNRFLSLANLNSNMQGSEADGASQTSSSSSSQQPRHLRKPPLGLVFLQQCQNVRAEVATLPRDQIRFCPGSSPKKSVHPS